MKVTRNVKLVIRTLIAIQVIVLSLHFGCKRTKDVKENVVPEDRESVETEAKERSSADVPVGNAVDMIERVGGLYRFAKSGDVDRLDVVLLNRTTVDDSDLGFLTSEVGIRTLDLAATQVTDISALRRLSNLETINLSKTNVGDDGVRSLSALVNLRGLSLEQTKVTDRGLAEVGALRMLVDLNLARTTIQGSGFRPFGKGSIETLDLAYTLVDDEGLAHISNIKTIKTLGLGGTRITNAGIVHLVGLPNLRALNLGGTKIDDAAVPELAKMITLQRLSILKTGITSEGMQKLKQALDQTVIDF